MTPSRLLSLVLLLVVAHHRRRGRPLERVRPRRARWAPRRTARDRPSRRVGLPARAHARRLRARGAAGRRLRRAGPRARRRTACSWRVTRTRSRATTDVATHPEFAAPPHDEDDRRRHAHRLVHRGLHARRAEDAAGESSASRRCGPQHALQRPLRRCPPSRRSSTSPSGSRGSSAARSASTPRRSTRPTSALSACRSRSRWSRTLERNGLNSARREGLRAVIRGRQPADARPRAARPARAAARRARPRGRGTSSCRATRAPTRTWPRRPACATSPRTRTASARRRTTSSRVTPPATRCRRPRSSTMPTRRARRPPVHVPQREQLPAARAALVGTDPAAYGNAAAEYEQFFDARRRRPLLGQRRHRGACPRRRQARPRRGAPARRGRSCRPTRTSPARPRARRSAPTTA